MAREHLKVLRDFLANFPEDKLYKFHMEAWTGVYYELFNDVLDSNTIPEANFENCSTAGCAIGYAVAIPEIKEAGLKLELTPWQLYTPSYEQGQGFYALKNFFRITHKEASYLFDSEEYELGRKILPADVVARIDEVLSRYEDDPRP